LLPSCFSIAFAKNSSASFSGDWFKTVNPLSGLGDGGESLLDGVVQPFGPQQLFLAK
jgi:hypothetical protein